MESVNFPNGKDLCVWVCVCILVSLLIFSLFVVVRAFSFIISTFGNYLLVFLVA